MQQELICRRARSRSPCPSGETRALQSAAIVYR